MEIFFVYVWLKLNTLISLFILLSLTLAVVLGGSGLFYAIEGHTKQEWWLKFKIPTWCFIGCLMSAIFIPSQSDTAVLVGTHYAVKLANSTEGEKVVSLIRQKANEYLDEQLKK